MRDNAPHLDRGRPHRRAPTCRPRTSRSRTRMRPASTKLPPDPTPRAASSRLRSRLGQVGPLANLDRPISLRPSTAPRRGCVQGLARAHRVGHRFAPVAKAASSGASRNQAACSCLRTHRTPSPRDPASARSPARRYRPETAVRARTRRHPVPSAKTKQSRRVQRTQWRAHIPRRPAESSVLAWTQPNVSSYRRCLRRSARWCVERPCRAASKAVSRR